MSESQQRHTVELNSRQREQLLEWLKKPNGAYAPTLRVTFEAVEGGGVLVLTRPYGPDTRADTSNDPHACACVDWGMMDHLPSCPASWQSARARAALEVDIVPVDPDAATKWHIYNSLGSRAGEVTTTNGQDPLSAYSVLVGVALTRLRRIGYTARIAP